MKGETIYLGESAATSYQMARAIRGIAVLDFFLRLLAIIGTLASAIAMGTTDETLPLFTQFALFSADYTDLPTFTFFVVANSIATAYLFFSLAPSILHIVRTDAQGSRIILVFFDTMAMGLLAAGASAATAIVYLAHTGNTKANWVPICQQFNSFCKRISGSLIGSYAAMVMLILLILLSAATLARRQ